MLQYQNQKLSQQLEVQKFEYSALQNKFNQLKDDQKSYDDTLATVKRSWEQVCDATQIYLLASFQQYHRGYPLSIGQLVDDLGSLSRKTRKTSNGTPAFEGKFQDLSPSKFLETMSKQILYVSLR